MKDVVAMNQYKAIFRDFYNYLTHYADQRVGVTDAYADYWEHAANDGLSLVYRHGNTPLAQALWTALYNELQRRATEYTEMFQN